MEMAILHKTHLCKEIIEVGSEEGSRWGAEYQERSGRNCAMLKGASKEMIFFLDITCCRNRPCSSRSRTRSH